MLKAIPDRAERPNPFQNDLAIANSNYCAFQNDKLIAALEPNEPVTPLTDFIHGQFRALVLNPHFTCLAAKSAIRRNCYRFGVYEELGSASATAGLARDLFQFVQEQPHLGEGFSSFVACFSQPNLADELDFERLLWQQLNLLHQADRPHHAWDKSVSADPHNPHFSFSFAERAFFIVGLGPVSSRHTRRFAWPTLVFNAHYQFEELRGQAQYGRMQNMVRQRDLNLQGNLNPNLTDFGQASEARQYSGRAVEADWRCPFHGVEVGDQNNPQEKE